MDDGNGILNGLGSFLAENLFAILAFLGLSGGGIYWGLRRSLATFNAEPFLPSVPLKILVAPLLHDPDNRQTDHVVDALRTHLKAGEQNSACDYRVLPKPVHHRAFATGRTQGQRIARRIQRLIALYRADLMIWGHVVKEDQTLHLAVTPRDAPDHHGNRRYVLESATLTLPEDFTGDLGAAIAALGVSEADAVTERLGHFIAPEARAIATAAEPFIDAGLPGMSNEQRGNLREAAGRAHVFVGMQTGDRRMLEAAVRAFRKAADDYTAGNVPLRWATTQNNLGAALAAIGVRESGTERLEEAAEAYRAALEERTRERTPLGWATTQMNLGTVLGALGQRESDTERLEEAVAAFRAALEEQTRERVPYQWAITHMNLGNALKILGERESGTERLTQAVAAFRAALEELSRARAPLDWAMTQNNLGNALATLGVRESDAERLLQAVEAYRAALEERTHERTPLDWATTQMNLGAALGALGERESGTERLDEAVAAFRAALEEQTRERVPYQWAYTQENLGGIYLAIFQKTRDRGKLETARSHAGAALEVYREMNATHDIGTAETLLQRIEAAMTNE